MKTFGFATVVFGMVFAVLGATMAACVGEDGQPGDDGASVVVGDGERYQVTTDLLDAGKGQTEARAMCDDGDRVLSGGCGFNGWAWGYADGPLLDDGAEGWACSVRYPTGSEGGTVQATAMCEAVGR